MAIGTFTGIGISDTVVVNERANLSLVFEGSGAVKLQRYTNKDWRDVPGASWTDSTEDIVYSGAQGTRHRLNCTARGANIHWELG